MNGYNLRSSNLADLCNITTVSIVTGVNVIRFGRLRIMTVTNASSINGKIGVLQSNDYPDVNTRQPMSYNLPTRSLGTLGVNVNGDIIAYSTSGEDLTTTASINGLMVWTAK